MATVVSVTVIKKFSYRGVSTEEFSNKYYLSGSVPSDGTAWRTLFDSIVTGEKICYPSNVTVVGGYGHDSDDPNASAVWSVDLVALSATVAGTLSPGGTWTQAPGDAAVWLRWKTSRLNSKGKPIYLRKYMHPAIINTAASPDTINAAQKTNLETFGGQMYDGTHFGNRTIRSRTHAETVLSHVASTWITTRSLKRRGRRP
jgi:hypothetical protein